MSDQADRATVATDERGVPVSESDSGTVSAGRRPHIFNGRYRLRSLLVALTLLSCWFAWRANDHRRHRMAVADLIDQGAEVSYYRPGDYPDDGLWGTNWLRHHWSGVMDDPPVRRMRLASFDERLDLRALESIPEIDTLTLEGSGFRDADMAVLANLPNLKFVALYLPELTDAGLSTLSTSNSLWTVSLDYTQVTNVGLHQMADSLPETVILTPDLDPQLEQRMNRLRVERLQPRSPR